jgi:hypothetical protein
MVVPESDTLPLTARKSRRLAFHHVIELERLCGSSNRVRDKLFRLLCQLKAKRHVFGDGHVRVERVALEDHRDSPFFRFEIVYYLPSD